MDIMLIGSGMVIIPGLVLMLLIIGGLLRFVSELTIEAYRNRNIAHLLAMLLIWSFVIGVALVSIGDVMVLFGGV